MVTEEHSFLVTQPDLHTINLEDFRFSKTKISAFKLIDESSAELHLLQTDWRQKFAQHYSGYISVSLIHLSFLNICFLSVKHTKNILFHNQKIHLFFFGFEKVV